MYSARIFVNNQANSHDNALYFALNTFVPPDNPSSSSPSEYSENGARSSLPESDESEYIPKFPSLKSNYATSRYYPYKQTYLPSRTPIHMQIVTKPKNEIECHISQYQKWYSPLHQYQATYLPTPVPRPQLIKAYMADADNESCVSSIDEYIPRNLAMKSSPLQETDSNFKKLSPKYDSTKNKKEYLPIPPEIIRDIEECIKGIKQSIRHSRMSNNIGATVGSNLLDQVSLLLWNYKVMAFLEENLIAAKRVNEALKYPQYI